MPSSPSPSPPCAPGPRATLQTQTASVQRRLVTILFADLLDPTALTCRLYAEDVREVVNQYFARGHSPSSQRHAGVVEKFAGYVETAVFGLLQSTDLDPIEERLCCPG